MRLFSLILTTGLVASCALGEDLPLLDPSGSGDVGPVESSPDAGRDGTATSPNVAPGVFDAGAGDDTDTPGPVPDTDTVPPEPRCEDRLAGTATVAGPQGIMVQLASVGDKCELERALDHACNTHPEMQDLIITSVEQHNNGAIVAQMDSERMGWLAPYLSCFANVFVGTVSETLLADPYAPSTLLNEDERWRWLRAAKAVAEQVAPWMDAEHGGAWHWYISYEANLNAFTDVPYRNAYVALLQQHIADITALNDGVVAWSPTFWTAPDNLGSGARTTLQSALTNLFDRVPVDWVLIQDHIGVEPSWTCQDALAYYDIVRAAGPNLASVQLNMEYFTIDGGGIRAGDPSDLAARFTCYQQAGANVGASFEYRYWYENHGH